MLDLEGESEIVEIIFDFHPSDKNRNWHLTLIAHDPNALTKDHEKKRCHGYSIEDVPPRRALTPTNTRLRDPHEVVSQSVADGAAGFGSPDRISLKVPAWIFREIQECKGDEAKAELYERLTEHWPHVTHV